MKLIGKVIVGLIAVLALLFIFKNAIIKTAVTTGAGAVLGQKLEISKLNLSVSKALIDIEGIKLYNPKKYPDPVMAYVPKVFVDVHLKKAMGGDIHIEGLELDLKEFVVVKNKDGDVNINDLKAIAESKKKDGDKPAEDKPAEKKPAPKVQVDNLHLKIGKVVFKDYSQGDEPVVKEYNINLDEKHQDIKSLEAVTTLIVFKVITKTNIAAIANIDLGSITNLVSGTLKGTTDAATKVIGTTTGTLKDTAGTLKDTADTLKDKIKLPFGK